MVLSRSNQPRETWRTLQDHIVATLQSTAWEEREINREYLDTTDVLNQEGKHEPLKGEFGKGWNIKEN